MVGFCFCLFDCLFWGQSFFREKKRKKRISCGMEWFCADLGSVVSCYVRNRCYYNQQFLLQTGHNWCYYKQQFLFTDVDEWSAPVSLQPAICVYRCGRVFDRSIQVLLQPAISVYRCGRVFDRSAPMSLQPAICVYRCGRVFDWSASVSLQPAICVYRCGRVFDRSAPVLLQPAMHQHRWGVSLSVSERIPDAWHRGAL